MINGTDIEDNPRIQQSMVDFGAYEFFVADGIPAAWLLRFNLPTNGSLDDWDNDEDGLQNWEEYQADTNPTNKKSFFLD